MKTILTIIVSVILSLVAQRAISAVTTKWVRFKIDLDDCVYEKGRMCTRDELTVKFGLNSDGSISGWK